MIRLKDSVTTVRAMALTAVLVVATAGDKVSGFDIAWTGSIDLNYDNGANWDGGQLPDATFGEEASISQEGHAVFLESFPVSPGGLTVQAGASLEIRDAGRLDVAGNITVGVTGTLIVQSGGTLTATGQPNLQGSTRMVGPSATFQASGFQMGSGHVLTAEITDPTTHSPLSTTGTATLDGSLVPVFNGVTPSNGSSWDLVDAATIEGAFNRSIVPVAPGVGMILSTVTGGNNGNVVRGTVGNLLHLAVNSVTGAASMSNLSTTLTEDIDGYSITSTDSILDMNSWSTFQDDGQTGWEESNPTDKHLSELNLDGSRVIDTEQTISLGTPISLPFGLAPDMEFTYHVAGGETRTGTMEISPNTLVLQVDPDTGAGVILNPTGFDVDMDGYSIISPSGSLDTNDWTSLADSDANWEEANPLPTHLSELNLSGSQTILQQETGAPIALGAIYDFDDPSVQQDLTFEFHLSDASGPGTTFNGLVEYGDVNITPLPDGDFDASNLVGLPDLNLVLFNWAAMGASLPTSWMHQRPGDTDIVGLTQLNLVLFNWAAMGGNLTAVPEPSGVFLLGLGLIMVVSAVIRKQS